MSDLGDIENNELNKNDLIEQFEKYNRSRTSYLGKITENIKKVNDLVTLDNQIITIKECLYKLEKYLHKLKTASQITIEFSIYENEIGKLQNKNFVLFKQKRLPKITKRRT